MHLEELSEGLDGTPHPKTHLVLHAQRIVQYHAVIARLENHKCHAHEILTDTMDGNVLGLNGLDVLDKMVACMHRASRAVDVERKGVVLTHMFLCFGVVPFPEGGVDRAGSDGSDNA